MEVHDNPKEAKSDGANALESTKLRGLLKELLAVRKALAENRATPSHKSFRSFPIAMKHISDWALNIAALRGASYADVRVISQRSRAITTKNGKVGGVGHGVCRHECAGNR